MQQRKQPLSERAESYILKGDYSGAIADFNELINWLFYGEYGLARIYALKGDACNSALSSWLNLNSNIRKVKRSMLDPAFSTIENRQEWRQFWKKEWYSTTEKGISEIEYYASAGKIDESKAVLQNSKKHWKQWRYCLCRALVNLASGKYQEIMKAVGELNTLNPGMRSI